MDFPCPEVWSTTALRCQLITGHDGLHVVSFEAVEGRVTIVWTVGKHLYLLEPRLL